MLVLSLATWVLTDAAYVDNLTGGPPEPGMNPSIRDSVSTHQRHHLAVSDSLTNKAVQTRMEISPRLHRVGTYNEELTPIIRQTNLRVMWSYCDTTFCCWMPFTGSELNCWNTMVAQKNVTLSISKATRVLQRHTETKQSELFV